MTYESFKQQLADQLRTFFSADTHISIQQFPHNNHLVLDGLTILEPGINISPTIYLNQYFEQFRNGTKLSDIQQQILQYYHRHCPLNSIDTDFFTCFDQVSPRIVYKLIHFEKNRELLREIPHIPYLDLAIVFYCLVPEAPYENASILIYNNHLAYWNISKDTLMELARKNTQILLPWRCSPLAELIRPALELLPEQEQASTYEILEEETASADSWDDISEILDQVAAPEEPARRIRWESRGSTPPVDKLILTYELTNAGPVYRAATWTGSVFRAPGTWKELTGLRYTSWIEIPSLGSGEVCEVAPPEQAEGQLVICGWMPGGTFPSEPGDVVAEWDLEDGGPSFRSIGYFDGVDIRLGQGGVKPDGRLIRWFSLPPVE